MTQEVLKNQITDLKPRTGMDPDQRLEMAEALSNALADQYRILINTQGLHWNVEGPVFYSLHKLTEKQYEDLFAAIDTMAERIRAIGAAAPQSLKELAERSIISDLPSDRDLKGRIDRIVNDYERAVKRLKMAIKLAEANSDVKSADLLTERVGVYEENSWMLRATAAA
jgi:starvation-inducible DNA-binding protein